MADSAGEWVFEYMHGVFQAPTWEVPIGTFIDENCLVFDNEEENKLSHTEVHQVRRHALFTVILRFSPVKTVKLGRFPSLLFV